jgi:NADPH2:quinone reductase
MNRLFEEGLLRPTVYDRGYKGLFSVPQAMNDLATRKTWGKAVISMEPHQKQAVL